MGLERERLELQTVQQRYIPVYNDSGEDIPPHSFVTPVGVTYNGGLLIDRVSVDGDKLAMVTDDKWIDDESWGAATCDWPARVKYHAADGTPAARSIENWGPKAGNWDARKNVTGWKLIGPADASMPQTEVREETAYIGIEVCRPS